MTAREYMDEVKMRLIRLQISTELPDQLILTFVNRARREVQKLTMDIYPERYGKIIIIPWVNFVPDPREDIDSTGYSGNRNIRMRLTPLPADFINPYVVTVNYTNVETLVTSEARRATKREIYNVNMHAWNSPTSEEPIYIVERDINSMFWLLYVGDLDTRPPGVLEDTIEVRIWYVAAINDIEDVTTAAYVSDTEQVLPADTEEMVLNYAVLYCMQNMDRGLMFSTIQAETERLKALYRQSYQVDKQRVGSLIPSKEGVN